MRVAAIDIGTNTVLLLVAERRGDDVVAVTERATITRLGQGVDRTRALAPEAIERTNACLDEYALVVQELDVSRVAVVGTSAMRDAKGGEAVREHVKRALGVEARVISGDEEARLTFAGAVSGLGVSGDVSVFDIGGGSTEIVHGTIGSRGEVVAIRDARSIDVGSVRMTERHLRSDPPSGSELASVRTELDRALRDVKPLEGGAVPVGIAGTVTTLAAVALHLDPYDGSRVHGHVMTRDDLATIVDELAALPLEKRRKVAGMEPKRADVIVAGGLVAVAVLDAMRARSLRISDRGVRWGLAVAELGSSATL